MAQTFTISRTADKWYVSFAIKAEKVPPLGHLVATFIGIDLGVSCRTFKLHILRGRDAHATRVLLFFDIQFKSRTAYELLRLSATAIFTSLPAHSRKRNKTLR